MADKPKAEETDMLLDDKFISNFAKDNAKDREMKRDRREKIDGV